MRQPGPPEAPTVRRRGAPQGLGAVTSQRAGPARSTEAADAPHGLRGALSTHPHPSDGGPRDDTANLRL